MGYNVIEGNFVYREGRIAIVCARFNYFIVEQLKNGAMDMLARHQVPYDKMDVVYVPGSFELPLVLQKLAQKQYYAGIIALGTIIRGSTSHFDYIAGESATGIAQCSLNHSLPVSFGILTTDNIDQAIERAGTKAGNKGADAALSLLETMDLMYQLSNQC